MSHRLPTPPLGQEDKPMTNISLLRAALYGLLALALLDLAGIIWLAAANPARAIPDIMVGSLTLIVGAVVGILVPSKRD